MTAPRTFLAALLVLLAFAGAPLWPACGAGAPAPTTPPPKAQPPSGTSGTTEFGGGKRTPIADRFAEVDTALGELVQGRIAFNAPARMRVNDSESIALIASPAMDADTLSAELRNRIGGADPIEIATLQIAPLMEARLEGAPAFTVTALTPEQQPVSRSAPTEWRWTVTAVQTGRHQLHLTINAIITVAGERYPRSLDVLNRDIEVQITARQRVANFLGANWQWLLGTLVVPFAVWFWNQRGRKTRQRK
jgi:uncharacterized membrane protein